MSVNQSMGDKNEPSQNRRSGRSGNPASQRNFQGGGGGGGRAVENGAHIQPPLKGTPDASFTGATVKPTDASIQKSTPGLPKAPQSNYAPIGATGPTTPVKGSTDASRGFPLQFGSISPGVMNVMQVPAPTNSASPNLDEQKRAQGIIHQNQGMNFSSQMGPPQLGNMGMGLGPQYPQQQIGNYGGTTRRTVKITHPDTHEELRLDKRTDRFVNGGSSVSGVSMQMPFHQPQLHLPFGGPNPQTPMQVMHKAERKYEVRKITQAKQRRLKGILNKLTPQNFEKVLEQVKEVNIDNANTLSGVVDQIFNKALMEPTFVEMYASFCAVLAVELPDFSEDNEKITFKRLLLYKCQEEFERGEREEEEDANRTEEDGEVKQTEEQGEEKRVKARRRMLGNIRLIGELYKKKMLTERIMHECIKKLLGQYPDPDEEDIEALCELMSTIGEMIDHPKAKKLMDVYFDMMFKLSNNIKLSSRVRIMLKDAIDLRKNKWQQRRKVEGPKKSEEVHRDVAQERQAQSNRLARGPNSNQSLRRGQPMDFRPKGSSSLPSNPQTGGFRGLPQQLRGYGNQDSRFEERHGFENRTLSVTLRYVGDDSITLDVNYVNRDTRNTGRVFDRVPPSSPPTRGGGRVSTPPQLGSDKVLSDDRLHDMSVKIIKEFYSANDEKEVGLCIKDLNAPRFYPTMISIWITDSFERKDMERDLLVKLLVNLTRSQDGIITQNSLIRGFESVLSTLEDAVNDAPKAPEFLGRIFARMLLENVIPYKEAWRLIHEGGEEQGQLVEVGLAAEVLGVILEMIKSEKGDVFLNNLRKDSNLDIQSFRSPTTKRTSRLDKFI